MKLNRFVLLISLACRSVQAANVEQPDILAGLRPEHPRLIITTAAWNDLRARRTNGTELAAIINQTLAEARTGLSAPPLVYKKEGKRLLAVSREALRRVELCSFAYRLTGEKVFVERAQTDMLAAAAFADWNPSHFLDTAEMTAALAIGYDWLFDVLPADTRATLRQDGKSLRAKILSPAGARFESASAQPPDDGVNQPNRNARILAVNTAIPESGKLTVEIELQPEL